MYQTTEIFVWRLRIGKNNAELLELNFVRLPFDTSVLFLNEQQNIDTLEMEFVRLPLNTSDRLYQNGQQNAETLEMDSIWPPNHESNGESFDAIALRRSGRSRPQLHINWGGGSEVPPPPYESVDNSVVFPNELQNAETLGKDSIRPPVLETNGESFDDIASRGPQAMFLRPLYRS